MTAVMRSTERKVSLRQRMGVGVFLPPLFSRTGGQESPPSWRGRRRSQRRFSSGLAAFLGLIMLCSSPARGENLDRISFIVTGLAGMPEYGTNFAEWSARLEEAFRGDSARALRIDGSVHTREEILRTAREETGKLSPGGEWWLILIGHGNYDGRRYKFNIKGPDLTDQDLGQLLEGLEGSRAVVVVGTSSAGALVPVLRGANRVVVAATRERERQPPLFPRFFSEAAAAQEADRDKNNRVSLLEAFLYSRRKVSDWFEEAGRIQTEHAILDDSGRFQLTKGDDESRAEVRQGTGLLAAVSYLNPASGPDALPEEQGRAETRIRIQEQIDALKLRRGEFTEEEYYRRLEALLVELAASQEETVGATEEEVQP